MPPTDPLQRQHPILEFKNVSKSFHGEKLLKNLSFQICKGEFVTLLGPSGCGKTTILRLIAGLDHPDSGEIYLDGQTITHALAEDRSTHTIFQNYALFPHMNIFENVAFGLRMKRHSSSTIRMRVQEALHWVRLQNYEKRMPHQLSGGQKQRVAIARAIVNRPRVLLLDECLSALDYHLRCQLQNELKGLQRRLGIPFIFVTHDQEEGLSLSDRIMVFRQGTIEQQGTPRAIYEDPTNLFVAKFMGNGNVFQAQIVEVHHPYQAMAMIEGKLFELAVKNYLLSRESMTLEMLVGQTLYVLLRPEDLRITELEESEVTSGLTGRILERNYKGATLDSVIQLESGKIISASEFFNEDDPDVDHSLQQRVSVHWVHGWEVVLDA